MTTARQRRGAAGEAAAVGALEAAGYRVLARNYRCPAGELDVVARDGDVLCFVEVKALTAAEQSEDFGSPFEKVTASKQRKIARAAAHYLQAHGLDEQVVCRFDVVGVWLASDEGPQRIEVRQDAFRLGG